MKKPYNLETKKQLELLKSIKKLIVLGLSFSMLSNITQKLNEELDREADLMFLKKNPSKNEEIVDITVSTVNVQNKYFNTVSKDDENYIMENYIEEGIDVIGTQEASITHVDEFEEIIDDKNYEITGEPRFGENMTSTFFAMTNESNNIIAKDNIYLEKTYTLPWIPNSLKDICYALDKKSLLPRILTHCVTNVDERYIHVYNTHIDFALEDLQKEQMKEVLRIIDTTNKEIKLPVVLTGDFNARIDSPNMVYFNNELNKRGIYMVPNTYPTHSDEIIDYIFVSDDFTLNYCKTVENEKSDHDSLFASFKLKK